jgi:hypothetical protein
VKINLKRFLVAVLVIGGAVLLFNRTAGGKRVYRTAGYERNYAWQGVEVGITYRYPVNSVTGQGRHRCVIAFPEGKVEQARLLYTTTSGELAPPLEFVSNDGAKGVYRTRDGNVTVDASSWTTKPALTDAGP